MLDYRNRKNKNRWWLAALTVLIISLLFILSNWGRGLLTGPLVFFAKPFWQASDNLGTAVAVQAQNLGQSRSALLIENKNLQAEIIN